ncbi:MAG: MlaD family protein [Pseudomonadota bacterium]
METRGNYILIGAFTLLGAIGLIAFFLAFARLEIDRAVSFYDVRFESVSGLSAASDVRFAGLPVGQVVDVRLSPDRDGTVMVRVEVDGDTPVREDSIATIESQGVTGVAFVAISAGSGEVPFLVSETGVPEIEAGRSVLQTLSEDAPALVEETLQLVRDVGELFDAQNRDRIAEIIENVEGASDAFADTLEDFASVAGSVDGFIEEINRFNIVLQGLAVEIDNTLITADATLNAWAAVADDATGFLNQGTTAFDAAESTLGATETYVTGGLTDATESLDAALAEIRGQIDTLGAQASAMIAGFEQTGTLANARLTETEATLAALDDLIAQTDRTLASVETSATDFGILIAEDGQALLDETRDLIADADRAVAAIEQTAQQDLPAILENVGQAADTVASFAQTLERDLTGATGQLDGLIDGAEGTLSAATTAFANANETMAAINSALAVGETALSAAEGAFGSADQVLSEQVEPLVARLSTTLDGLDQAIAQVAEDLPGISTSVREASAAAEAAFRGLNGTVQAAGPGVASFAQDGLPQIAALAREARSLSASLERLVRQIERNPARFIQGEGTSEFRR